MRCGMLEKLKERVYLENMKLVTYGLVVLTWGNVSARDFDTGLIVIKPSGVDYAAMKPDDMVVLDLDGNVVEGRLKPSSDTPTHLELYRKFPKVGGIVHTHSMNAVAWSQAGRDIPAYGTTHADAFHGDIPCARALTREEIETDYELNTGKVIVETFADIDYEAIPAVLCKNHGPFTWGSTPEAAVKVAVTLEAVAEMAMKTERLAPSAADAVVPQYLLDKHYYRKHGEGAYYGQK